LAGAGGPVVCADVVAGIGKYVAIFGSVCIVGFFGRMPKSSEPASTPGALRVDGPTPTPSTWPRGKWTGGGVMMDGVVGLFHHSWGWDGFW
jgi:hypothetical protein